MEPHGQARGPQKPYPPTPLGAEALRCASAKALACQRTCSARRLRWVSSAGERNPPKHGRFIAERGPIQGYAFLHGQGRACTPECLLSPKRFIQTDVSARRHGFLRRRMKILLKFNFITQFLNLSIFFSIFFSLTSFRIFV